MHLLRFYRKLSERWKSVFQSTLYYSIFVLFSSVFLNVTGFSAVRDAAGVGITGLTILFFLDFGSKDYI